MTKDSKDFNKSKSYQKDCHLGPRLVLDNSLGLKIYASSYSEAKHNYHKFDLVISLGKENFDVISSYSNLRSKGLLELVNKFKISPEHLCLDWPDFSTPSLSREFWIELSRILKKKGRDRLRYDKNYKVLVHCMGGHGRTGTLLCILGNLILNWESNLIERIREIYCWKVVESNSQIKYINEITGGNEKEEGSKQLGEFNYIHSYTNINDSNLPLEMCRDCKILYNTIEEAIDCERKHKEGQTVLWNGTSDSNSNHKKKDKYIKNVNNYFKEKDITKRILGDGKK